MDKFTLEHLAPYLPYKLNLLYSDGSIRELLYLDVSGLIPVFKPILRPLSDLTKEIEHNGKRFVPISAILERFGDSESLENALLWLMDGSYPYFKFSYCIIELFISWHFDVFGLIEKGLAIEYNTVKGGF